MLRLLVCLVVAGCGVKSSSVDEDDDDEDGDDPEPVNDEFVVEECTNQGDVRDCLFIDAYFDESRGLQHCAGTDVFGLPPKIWSECADRHECLPGDTHPCLAGGDGSTIETECLIDTYGQLRIWCSPTPLAIDLGGDGFAFEPAGAGSFDIAGTGSCLDVDWPGRSTAWLALDRDGDGAIADGRELFGTGTPMPGNDIAKNGFVALATLDDDEDGAVTPRDDAFARLVLWTDVDDDRRGTAGELLGLAQLGIASLPLAYDRDRECDARGNCIVERASVTTRMGPRPLVDLHLTCQ